jgi:hypothetical protein
MVAHTGYLVFARSVVAEVSAPEEASDVSLSEEHAQTDILSE